MPEKKNLKKTTQRNKPIGIFDSGFGGLTVMSALAKMLPAENMIYFGDSAHVPYGSKSKEAVIGFSKSIADFLISKDVKMIVVACNTASAFALPVLQKTLKVPVVGVIEPGAKTAVRATKNKKIGVIGTEGTVNSRSYEKAIKKISNCSVYAKACPLFVPLVEEGWCSGEIAEDVAGIYLKPLAAKKIDTLVLGCTHYPLLKKTIAKTAGTNIELIDSAAATANEVKDILAENGLIASRKTAGRRSFYASDNPEKFKKIGGSFFCGKIDKVKKANLEAEKLGS